MGYSCPVQPSSWARHRVGAPLAAYLFVALFGAGYTALCGVRILSAARMVPDRASEGPAALSVALAIGQAAGPVMLGVLFSPTAPARSAASARPNA